MPVFKTATERRAWLLEKIETVEAARNSTKVSVQRPNNRKRVLAWLYANSEGHKPHVIASSLKLTAKQVRPVLRHLRDQAEAYKDADDCWYPKRLPDSGGSS